MKKILTLALLLAAQPCLAAKQDVLLLPNGKVDVRADQNSPWASITEKTRMPVGSEVRTTGASTAGILFPDGSRFMLGNNSQFEVESTSNKEASFKLKLGRLRAAVSGYFSSRFKVRTPTAVCAVRGTEFDLEVAGNGNTEMSVAEGLVEVNDSKGAMAVVSSEEKISVGADGMSKPEMVALSDSRAGGAARPMAVRQESARERTRTMMEELRNRELKANEAQLGKDAIDAFGRRVRLEEYLLRPASDEFKILFLSKREDQNRLDWGHLIERFNADIPDDISQVAAIIDGMYMSETAPTNWMEYFEVYLTNTVDSIKETIDFTAPVRIDFKGYTGSPTDDYRYYPASIDYRQVLSGPGVADLGAIGGAGSLTNTGLASLASDERVQFRQKQDWDSTTASNFTFTQWVVDGNGRLGVLEKTTLNPADGADVAAGGTNITDNAGLWGGPFPADPDYSATINPITVDQYPSGSDRADFLRTTTYEDLSTVSARKLLVSNDGEIIRTLFDPAAPENSFLADGSYNLEMVIGSSLFQGRNIDVLFAPEILSQKKTATTTPDYLTVN